MIRVGVERDAGKHGECLVVQCVSVMCGSANAGVCRVLAAQEAGEQLANLINAPVRESSLVTVCLS